MKKIYATTGFLAALLLSSFTTFAQTQSRDELIKEIETRRKELLALEQSFLSPTEQDRARYSSHTGGIKGSLMIRGGGAYYSFIRKTHEYGYGTDIGLYLGDLATGFAGANYGLLVLLGDVPLESVGLELPEVNILANYTPATQLPHARVEQGRFGEGTEIEGLKVKDRLPLRADATYVVRSIDYDTSDIMVAFKVVRVDSDGSAIILWKLLKQYPLPRLARNTN